MNALKNAPGVLVISPELGSQGGISTVVMNYKRTAFWADFRCKSFASTRDAESPWMKLGHDVSRWLKFSFSLLWKKKPWVASIHTSQGASFYRKLSYQVICRMLRVPVVLHIHPARFIQFYRNGGPARRWMIRLAGDFSDQIVVLSTSIKSELAEIYSPLKIVVLSNPVDIGAYTAKNLPRTERPRVLFLGWIVRAKGVYDLVDAIPRVLEEFPDALFTFAGNKEIGHLRALLSEKGLNGSSEVLGWVDGQGKINLLRTSWLLVLPSYTEGVPNVILEAMASELPIVTTAVGGIPNVLKHGTSALFVEPGNTIAISDAIRRLIRDDKLRRSLASAAFHRVCDEHSLEVVDNDLRKIYDRYRRRTVHN